MPSFSHLGEKDLSCIDLIGKIVENSDFSMPIVAFNTATFKALCYSEQLREFIPVPLADEDNLSHLEIPKNFKSIYIPDDKFMIIGGVEKHTNTTSSRCFGID